MRKWLLMPLLALSLAACGKKVDQVALLLKAGDQAKAIELLEAQKAKEPELRRNHELLFVLYQYQVAQGEPAKHDAYLQSAIGEYSWLAKDSGISPDYKDMESSLKATDKSRASFEAAYKLVYDR